MADATQIIRSVFGVSRGRYRLNQPILVRQPREALGAVYKQAGFTFGAEVGVKRGDYAEAILVQHPDLDYVCVDIWDRVLDQYQARRRRYLAQAKARLVAYRGVMFVKKTSLEAAAEVSTGVLDFVYIDAAHDFDNVVQDLIQWSAKVKSGGIIALHDYYQHRYGGVVPAVDAYVRCHRIDPWYVTYELMPTVFWVKP